MALFWEFFTFELKFRFKSLSTYVYFALWLTFSFLNVASESFGPIGNSNGKILLNSALRKYLQRRWSRALRHHRDRRHLRHLASCATSSATPTRSSLPSPSRNSPTWADAGPVPSLPPSSPSPACWSATYLGTFAPWADHTRIGPNHLWAYLQPFLSIIVVQIFFIGSAFFAVAALTRKIFIVYLQGVALFMLYLIGITVFSATRSLEHFWSGILDPIGLILFDDVTRYWTVIEKNTLFVTWSPRSLGGCLPLQPPSVANGRPVSAGWCLGAVSHVGGGAHCSLSGPPRRKGKATRPGRGATCPFARRRSAPAGASGVYSGYHVCPIPLALSPAPPKHSPRHTILGDRRPHDRFRD